MPNLIKLRDAVDAMVKVIVSDPESVVVELNRSVDSAALHVFTSKRDMGAVVGKQGRTAKSLRVLVHAAAQKIHTVVTLDISASELDALSEMAWQQDHGPERLNSA